MPLGKAVGANIRKLQEEHPEWDRQRIIAAALQGARDAGNTNVLPPTSVKRRRRKMSRG